MAVFDLPIRTAASLPFAVLALLVYASESGQRNYSRHQTYRGIKN